MTIFSKIVAGEIPCHKIAEDDQFFAFLDINPVQPGHTLVIPKKEEDYIFDLEDKKLGDMMIFAKKVAKAIQATTKCTKVSVAVIGLEVRHAHIHLIPIKNESDFRFGQQRSEQPDHEALEHMATEILHHL